MIINGSRKVHPCSRPSASFGLHAGSAVVLNIRIGYNDTIQFQFQTDCLKSIGCKSDAKHAGRIADEHLSMIGNTFQFMIYLKNPRHQIQIHTILFRLRRL